MAVILGCALFGAFRIWPSVASPIEEIGYRWATIEAGGVVIRKHESFSYLLARLPDGRAGLMRYGVSPKEPRPGDTVCVHAHAKRGRVVARWVRTFHCAPVPDEPQLMEWPPRSAD